MLLKAIAAATVVSASAAALNEPRERGKLASMVLRLLRPYRGWLFIVFVAMLFEIAMSLAAPWPLKLVLDDALGKHQLPKSTARRALICSPSSLRKSITPASK